MELNCTEEQFSFIIVVQNCVEKYLQFLNKLLIQKKTKSKNVFLRACVLVSCIRNNLMIHFSKL